MFEIMITVDMNDADYNTKVSEISQADLDKIMPLIDAIKAFQPYKTTIRGMDWTHRHNYPCATFSLRNDLGEKAPEELYPQFDENTHYMFQDLCHFGEDGFHTIKSIYITPLVKKTKLL